jgi:hypothetical protein
VPPNRINCKLVITREGGERRAKIREREKREERRKREGDPKGWSTMPCATAFVLSFSSYLGAFIVPPNRINVKLFSTREKREEKRRGERRDR